MSESAPVAQATGIKGVLARAAKSVGDDYASGGPRALLRNRTCQIIGGVAVAWFALGALGGPPGEIDLKGLHLGMPVEDAARVLLSHGFTVGGDANPTNTWATDETAAARVKQAAEYIRRVAKERGDKSMADYIRAAAKEKGVDIATVTDALLTKLPGEVREAYISEIVRQAASYVRKRAKENGARDFQGYLKLTLPPEVYERNRSFIAMGYGASLDSDEALERDVKKWLFEGERNAGVPLLPETEQYPDLFAYLQAQDSGGYLAFDNLEKLLAAWGDPHGLLVPESETFLDVDAYVAKTYPNGRPYRLGGKWDGSEELRLDADVLQGQGWTFVVDADRKVTAIKLWPDALDKLLGSDGLRGEEFARAFARAQGLPSMEVSTTINEPELAQLTGEFTRDSWLYVDHARGWLVAIGPDKTLALKRIPQSSM